MNTNLLAIIKQIVSEQGEAILAEPRRLKGLINDYAKNEPRAERLAFDRCIEYGAYSELKITPAEERAAVKERLAQKMYNEEGLDITLCAEVLDLLEAAVFGDAAPDPAAAGDEWVTVAEQREAGKVEEQSLPAADNEKVNNLGSTSSEEFRPLGWFLRERENTNSDSPDMLKRENEEKRREVEILKKKLAKTKNGLTAAVVIGIIACTISIGIGVWQYNEAEGRLRYQYSQYNSLESQYKSLLANNYTLETQHKRLLKNWIIKITSMSVGNTNKNYQWINKSGEKLNASEVYHLNVMVYYKVDISRNFSFDIKWYYPDGSLQKWNKNTPSEYTFSIVRYLSRGEESFSLGDWGWDVPGNFPRGIHKIEVWYEGICLGITTVTLN